MLCRWLVVVLPTIVLPTSFLLFIPKNFISEKGFFTFLVSHYYLIDVT